MALDKFVLLIWFAAPLCSMVHGECQTINPSSNCHGGHNKSGSLANLFGSGYDRTLQPNSSTPVKVGITLVFEFLKWHNSIFSVSAYFRQKWNDPRFIRKEGITRFNSDHIINLIWEPDVYVMNSWNPPSVVQTGFVDIQHNGDVTYIKQLQFQAYCPWTASYAMNNDGNVNCSLHVTSFTYDATDVVFYWDEEPVFSGLYQNVTSFKTSEVKAKHIIGTTDIINLDMQIQTRVNRDVVHYVDDTHYDIK